MKSILILTNFTVLIFSSFAMAENIKCTENNKYSFAICGNWENEEIDEIVSMYSGTEEIHKIIKQKENYYILHTCGGRTKDQICMGGFVYVFERINGELKQKPDRWDWVF